MDIERLDKILLSDDDAQKILEWEEKNRSNINTDTIDFPLKEGVMVYTKQMTLQGKPVEISSGLYFRVTDTGISFATHDWRDKQKIASTFISPTTDYLNLDVTLHWKHPLATKALVQKDFQANIFLFMATMVYMTHHREVIERTEQKRRIAKKPKSGKSGKRFTKLTSVQYVLNFNKEETDKRRYERHTESWSQRGFYRHYKKSGKIVWVDPQVKGARNVQPEPKTYKP